MYTKDLKIRDVRMHSLEKFYITLLFRASVKSDCTINLSS